VIAPLAALYLIRYSNGWARFVFWQLGSSTGAAPKNVLPTPSFQCNVRGGFCLTRVVERLDFNDVGGAHPLDDVIAQMLVTLADNDICRVVAKD
jgi:hypothetical protein